MTINKINVKIYQPERGTKSLKRIIILLVCMLMIHTVYAADEITVDVDSSPVCFDTPVRIVNGRTMVPVRAVFEALGAQVDWNAQERTVYAQKDGKNVSMTIGSNRLLCDGLVRFMDAVPLISDNRTYIPARFAAESLGSTVLWDAQERAVHIKTDTPPEVRYYKVYADSSVSFAYPEGWFLDISFPGIIFIDNQGDSTANLCLGMVSVSVAEFVNDSFADTVSAKYDYLVSDCETEITEFKNTTVNGCAAAVFKYFDTDGDFIESYLISGGSRAYFVEFISGKQGAFDEIYRNVLSSFTILG